MTDEILAVIQPRAPRRWIAVSIQSLLGVFLVWVGATLPEGSVIWRILLIGFGAIALYGAVQLYRATADRIELTRDTLRDSQGRILARVETIRGIDRGAFAFKPSSGFLLRLSEPGPRIWVPGLWWRLGRYVGVGGVTPAREAKEVATIIEAMLAEGRGAR